MEKEEQLLSDDIYDMIDEDLSRGISGNFESLVDSPLPAEQRVVTNHLQHGYPYNQGTSIYVEGQQPNIQYPNQLQREQLVEHGFEGHHVQQRHQEQQLVQNYQDRQPFQNTPWDSVEEMPSDVSRSGFVGDSLLPELTEPPTVAPILPLEVPSLQPWSGQFNFTASITTENKDKNKWCYSQTMNKLYVVSEIAVPLNIKVNPSVEGFVTFTPVFKQSQHMKDPVLICYNCKSKRGAGEGQVADHIVQIEGSRCQYRTLSDERRVVTVPLPQPPPGENYSIILFKIMCLTSCIGGPNRRPFCLVLTLHCSNSGRVIGRQIVDIKCCKCPQRDMVNDENPAKKTTNSNSSNTVNTQNLDEGTGQMVRKLASQIKVGQKRKRATRTFELEIVERSEPGVQSGFVNIAVPVEFEPEVKRFVNGLMATRHLRRNCPDLLLYPEADSDTTESERETF